MPAYPPEFFTEIKDSREPRAWLKLMDRYNVEFAIVKRKEGLGVLFEENGWPMVFLDGAAAVFVRPSGENDLKTRGRQFRILRAMDRKKQLEAKSRAFPEAMQSDLEMLSLGGGFSEAEVRDYAAAAVIAGDPELSKQILVSGSNRGR
jgi:hypothetical protein